MKIETQNPETLALHAGQEPDPTTTARAVVVGSGSCPACRASVSGLFVSICIIFSLPPFMLLNHDFASLESVLQNDSRSGPIMSALTLSLYDDCVNATENIESVVMRLKSVFNGHFEPVPDAEDRLLICDAIVYWCACFCTRGRATIPM